MLTGSDYITLQYQNSIYKQHILQILKMDNLSEEGRARFLREVEISNRLAEKLQDCIYREMAA